MAPLLRAAFAALIGCGAAAVAACHSMAMPTPIPDPVRTPGSDPHSYARPGKVRVEHADLRLTLSFARRQVEGTVAYRLHRSDRRAPLVLDTRDLRVEGVEVSPDGADYRPAAFLLGPKDAVLGRSLTVALADDTRWARVRFRATEPEGLLFLDPEQTAGRRAPFVFSQSQAILARTFWPCQDTPSVRATFTAEISVDEDVRVVMAAADDNDRSRRPADRTYRFHMELPVPSYLVAFAAGDLAFAPLGPRTGVFAEPETLEAAVWELADTEAMVEAAESLYGPYRWGRYDLLVLPPSFPFGGMENPRLTFATPTILAGDRSLVSLVAHELAHSWSGNLVTNATWAHLWLNEGFTTYLERRIVEAVYGPSRAEMEAVVGLSDLVEDFRTEAKAPGDQRLVPDLRGRDPDEAMTNVPYEKGALLLRTLERLAGREPFDRFLRAWFSDHAFTSVDTETFAAYLRTRGPGPVRAYDLAPWTAGPGLPEGAALPDEGVFRAVDAAADAVLAGRPLAEAADAEAFSTQAWLRFLRRVHGRLSAAGVEALEAAHGLATGKNAEVRAAFLQVAVAAGHPRAGDWAAAFLTRVGRRKFLVPIYRALLEAGQRERAQRIYEAARPGYHALARTAVEALLAADG